MFEFARFRASSAQPRHRAEADTTSDPVREPEAGSDARERLLALMAVTERGKEERAGPNSVTGRADAEAPGVLVAHSGVVQRLAFRWLPESWRQSRVDPGKAGFLGVALVGAVVAAVVAVTVLTPRPSAEPVSPRLPVVAPVASTPTTSAAPDDLVISMVGRVHEPGLVTVEPGSRVADALKAAGGPLPGTDVTTLNLARKLADGEQLYVGVPIPPDARGSMKSGQGSAGVERKVNLNTADSEELEELPGVGPVTAGRIVKWRTDNGGFESVDQLLAVSGIGDATLSQLQDLVRV